MEAIIGYIVIGVVTLLVVLQLWFHFKAKAQQGKPLPELEGLIDAALLQRPTLLFYFYSASCGPCRALTPHIDQLQAEHDNVIKVDVQQQPEIARRLSVMGTPTLIRIHQGVIAEVQLGPVTPTKLRQMLGD